MYSKDTPPIDSSTSLTSKSKRKSKTKISWQWKSHTTINASQLAQQLIEWLRANPHEKKLINFLTDVAGISFNKLNLLASESIELEDALELAYDIIASRIENDWSKHPNMNINQYAAKLYNLYSPLVQERLRKKNGKEKGGVIQVVYDSLGMLGPKKDSHDN